jgi:hypothetical protein
VEDKETQTGDLKYDVTDKATQATLKAMGKASGTQTGRRLQRMSAEDPDMIKSGQYLSIRAGRKAADNTTAIGSTGRGEGMRRWRKAVSATLRTIGLKKLHLGLGRKR